MNAKLTVLYNERACTNPDNERLERLNNCGQNNHKKNLNDRDLDLSDDSINGITHIIPF